MSLIYGARKYYGQRPNDPGHQISCADATRFMVEVAKLDEDLVQEVKESREKFHIICEGFKIIVSPHRVGSWIHHHNHLSHSADISLFIDAAIELSGGNRVITIDCGKPTITVTESHAKVVRDKWCTKLRVKNQDGKWILQTGNGQYQYIGQVTTTTIAGSVKKRLKEGLANARPLTKEEILAKGLPDPHKFDTDDRLTEEDSRGSWGVDGEGTWIRIRDGLLDRIRVDGVVTINPDRTVREAIDPSGQDAWFQITCETKIRSIRFVVLSDGEQYYIMSKIGSRYKVVESTQINSLVDAGNMTKIDQTMIKEAMDSYVASLQLA